MKLNIILIASAVIILGIAFFALNSINSKQKEIDISNGRLIELKLRADQFKDKVVILDSLNNLQRDSVILLKKENRQLVAKAKAIEKKYNDERNRVFELSDTASLDYFKCNTQDFATVQVSEKPISYEVPVSAIRDANEKFVTLDEEYAVNDNLTGQVINQQQQLRLMDSIAANREQKISQLGELDVNKSKQIDLLTENARNYEKMVKREQRKKGLFKITTSVGIVAIGLLLLR